MEFVVDKIEIGTTFVPISRFSPIIITPPTLHQHLNPHANLITIRDTDGGNFQSVKAAMISGQNIGWKVFDLALAAFRELTYRARYPHVVQQSRDFVAGDRLQRNV